MAFTSSVMLKGVTAENQRIDNAASCIRLVRRETSPDRKVLPFTRGAEGVAFDAYEEETARYDGERAREG